MTRLFVQCVDHLPRARYLAWGCEGADAIYKKGTSAAFSDVG